MERKKGFTLVELLVVIAILAILAAVSVVGYLSFTNKAKESNDVSLTTQMNTVLQANEATKKPQTLKEVLKQLNEDGGINLEVITPNSQGYNYAWDKASNRILLLDGTSIVAPNDVTDTNKADTIIIIKDETSLNDALNNGYGIALASSYNLVTTYADTNTSFKLEKAVSFDDYKNLVSNLEITSTEANNIYISGDFNSLKVDTKSDISIYGKCNKLELTNGKIKVEDNANITTINAENALEAKVFITNNGTVGNIVGEENILDDNSKIPTDGYPSKPKDEDKYFQSGSGTINNPYIITTVDQFVNISFLSDKMKNGNEYHFKLVNDIDLRDYQGEFNKTIDARIVLSYYFNGSLDGNNHILYANKKLQKVFANACNYANFKNLDFYLDDSLTYLCDGNIFKLDTDIKFNTVIYDNIDIYNISDKPVLIDQNQGIYFGNTGQFWGDSSDKPNWADYRHKITIKNCDAYLNVRGQSYNAIFIGGNMNYSDIIIENSNYHGTYIGEITNLLNGNISSLNNDTYSYPTISAKNVKNLGQIIGTTKMPMISCGLEADSTKKDYITLEAVNLGSVRHSTDETLKLGVDENNNLVLNKATSETSYYVLTLIGGKRKLGYGENSSYRLNILLTNVNFEDNKYIIPNIKDGRFITKDDYLDKFDENATFDESEAINIHNENGAKFYLKEKDNILYYVCVFTNSDYYFENKGVRGFAEINTAKIKNYDKNDNPIAEFDLNLS